MKDKMEPRWTPAVLAALMQGDVQNAVIAATPGGIEAQEAAGQRDFVASETLPCKPSDYHTTDEEMRHILETLGIEFLEPVDDLFWYVRLPAGWQKRATDHSMWSKLYDDKGRERASVFYKAAFYDRSAHINLTRRYSCQICPVNGWGSNTDPTTLWHAIVTDCEKPIWQSEPIGPKPDKPGREWWNAKDALCKVAIDWCDEHYPEWRNPLAYWD